MSLCASTDLEVWDGADHLWLQAPGERLGPDELANLARYERDLAVQLKARPSRLAHSLSVAHTARCLAALYGVDEYQARVAGTLHDWSKALGRDETLARAHGLGIDMGVALERVEPLLHGPIAARELPGRYPEVAQEVWRAVERHTTAARDMSPLDMVVFVADGIEPLRRAVPAIKAQRALVGKVGLEELFFTSFADGISYVVATRRYLYPKTIEIYNELADAHARGARGEA